MREWWIPQVSQQIVALYDETGRGGLDPTFMDVVTLLGVAATAVAGVAAWRAAAAASRSVKAAEQKAAEDRADLEVARRRRASLLIVRDSGREGTGWTDGIGRWDFYVVNMANTAFFDIRLSTEHDSHQITSIDPHAETEIQLRAPGNIHEPPAPVMTYFDDEGARWKRWPNGFVQRDPSVVDGC